MQNAAYNNIEVRIDTTSRNISSQNKRNTLVNRSRKKNKDATSVLKPTLATWRTFPTCKWAFHNVREIVPTANIKNNPQEIWELEYRAPPFETNSPIRLLKSILEFTSFVENAVPFPILLAEAISVESDFNLKSDVSALKVIF